MKSIWTLVALLVLTASAVHATPPPSQPLPHNPKSAVPEDPIVAELKPDAEPPQPIVVASQNALCNNAQMMMYTWYLPIHDAFNRRMIQAWPDATGRRIKAREANLWKQVEKNCPPDVVTALSNAYVEWSTKNLKPAPSFAAVYLEKRKDDGLKEFIERFAASVRKSDTYAAMAKDPHAQDFFARFPHLNDPILDVTRLRTSIDDPEALDRVLTQIKEAVGNLPDPYKTLFRDIKLYVSMGSNDLKALCRWENAVACYAPASDTVYIQPASNPQDARRFIAHELAHAYAHRLPKAGQTNVARVASKILASSAVQHDLVRNGKGLTESWKDGSHDPKYAFVSAYGASNVDEYIATYVEDVLIDDARGVVRILQTEHRPQVVETLAILGRTGFFGKQPDAFLQQIYRKAGLGNEAVH